MRGTFAALILKETVSSLRLMQYKALGRGMVCNDLKANFAVTELASGITNAATSFLVDASIRTGPFIVLVRDSTPVSQCREIMEVGSINKDVFRCVAGQKELLL